MQENKREKSPIKSRILQYIQKKGITRYAFYKETGMTRGVLDQQTGISEDNIACFVRYAPEVSLDWLICGKGEMIPSEGNPVHYGTPERAMPVVNDVSRSYAAGTAGADVDLPRVPLYNVDSAADLNVLFSGSDTCRPEKYLSIPDLPPCDGALRLRGDAMYPLLRSGDIILYKRVKDFMNIVWGEIYLVSFVNDGEEYVGVRYLNSVEGEPGKVRLAGYDPQHAPVEVTLAAVRVLALVKASVRYHTMG